jgi:hypothetical protein
VKQNIPTLPDTYPAQYVVAHTGNPNVKSCGAQMVAVSPKDGNNYYSVATNDRTQLSQAGTRQRVMDDGGLLGQQRMNPSQEVLKNSSGVRSQTMMPPSSSNNSYYSMSQQQQQQQQQHQQHQQYSAGRFSNTRGQQFTSAFPERTERTPPANNTPSRMYLTQMEKPMEGQELITSESQYRVSQTVEPSQDYCPTPADRRLSISNKQPVTSFEKMPGGGRNAPDYARQMQVPVSSSGWPVTSGYYQDSKVQQAVLGRQGGHSQGMAAFGGPQMTDVYRQRSEQSRDVGVSSVKYRAVDSSYSRSSGSGNVGGLESQQQQQQQHYERQKFIGSGMTESQVIQFEQQQQQQQQQQMRIQTNVNVSTSEPSYERCMNSQRLPVTSAEHQVHYEQRQSIQLLLLVVVVVME